MILFYRPGLALLSCLVCPISQAAEVIAFKQPFSPKYGWLSYGVVLFVLLVVTFILAKKNKYRSLPKSQCAVLEKKYLGNKTIMYVVEYQDQRFILADNQHALALHLLSKEACHE